MSASAMVLQAFPVRTCHARVGEIVEAAAIVLLQGEKLGQPHALVRASGGPETFGCVTDGKSGLEPLPVTTLLCLRGKGHDGSPCHAGHHVP